MNAPPLRERSRHRQWDRLWGKWLKAAGFDRGQRFEVEAEAGKLTIWAA